MKDMLLRFHYDVCVRWLLCVGAHVNSLVALFFFLAGVREFDGVIFEP
jgi:hypothetical protein